MKKHKKSIVPIIILVLITVFFVIRNGIYQSNITKIDNINIKKTNKKVNQYPKQTQALVRFIRDNLLTKKGIYTDTITDVNSENSNLATGKELLTESSGMWLQYLAVSDSKSSFKNFYKNTKATFWKNNQFNYRYDSNTHKLTNVNATLDDLRIVRALIMYDQKHKTNYYSQDITNIYHSLKKTVIKDGVILDYYDPIFKKGADSSSLAYYDLNTLNALEQTESDRREYKQQVKVVKEGYLSDDFPLYASNFNVNSRIYSSDDLNTSEALEVLLHLAQIDQLKKTSKRWLIEKIETKSLFNSYSIQGTPMNHETSVANYALAAQIFKVLDDTEHYQAAMAIVWQNQVQTGKYQGGLGDKKNEQFYSYNNLNALIAAE